MRKTAILLAAWLATGLMAFAQMEMPKPGPEHKKLDYFAGSWTLEGDVKPVMGPGGKVTETEKCDWMEGEFYLVCKIDFKSNSMGNGSGISIMGYSTDDRVYTYREFNSWGEFTDAKGSLDNTTWTWTSDDRMGGATMKGRFIMKVTSPTTYDFTFEMSQDGTKWTLTMDGRATKAK